MEIRYLELKLQISRTGKTKDRNNVMTDMKKDEIYQMDYIGLMNEMQADVPRIIFVSQQGAASRKKV
jgi:hypothetical protein